MREAKGLSQAEIATQLFISRQAVSRWESGNVTPDVTNSSSIS
ncbi:helix-turn-helix domain-containing protein [Loigolactobacillus coryniformis]|nr:helix-turn-helix transcriptional regulator [Loigolactobacillus coryniformis]